MKGLDWMFTDDGKDKKESPVPPKHTAPTQITQNTNTYVANASAAATTGGTDYNKALDDVCEAGHKDGADFWAFHKTIAKMDGKPITDEMKYQTAFAAFEAQNVTPQKLVESGNYYMGLLDKEATTFANEMAGATTTDVTNKKAAVDAMDKENQDLQKKIADNLTKMAQMNSEILTSTNNIANESANFNNQLNIKKSVFVDRVTKIKTYLYGTTS